MPKTIANKLFGNIEAFVFPNCNLFLGSLSGLAYTAQKIFEKFLLAETIFFSCVQYVKFSETRIGDSVRCKWLQRKG